MHLMGIHFLGLSHPVQSGMLSNGDIERWRCTQLTYNHYRTGVCL
jgi:hypothetical protein